MEQGHYKTVFCREKSAISLKTDPDKDIVLNVLAPNESIHLVPRLMTLNNLEWLFEIMHHVNYSKAIISQMVFQIAFKSASHLSTKSGYTEKVNIRF